MSPEVLIVEQESLTTLERNELGPHIMEWDSQQAARQNDLLQILKALLSKILEEIAGTEESLGKRNQELAALTADPSTRLGSILEAKRELMQLDAYLKGLKFAQSTCNHLLYE